MTTQNTTAEPMAKPPNEYLERLDAAEKDSDYVLLDWLIQEKIRPNVGSLQVSYSQMKWPNSWRSAHLRPNITQYRIDNLTASTEYKFCVDLFRNKTTAAGTPIWLGQACDQIATNKYIGHSAYATVIAALLAFLFICCCVMIAQRTYTARLKRRQLQQGKQAPSDNQQPNETQDKPLLPPPTEPRFDSVAPPIRPNANDRPDAALRLSHRLSSGDYDDESLYPKVDSLPPDVFLPEPAPPDQIATRVRTQVHFDIPLVRPVPRPQPIRFIYSEQSLPHKPFPTTYY